MTKAIPETRSWQDVTQVEDEADKPKSQKDKSEKDKGQGIVLDEKAQEQPKDKRRARDS